MNMMDDWQTPAALLVVAVTALAFAWRFVKRRKRGLPSCASCPSAAPPKFKQANPKRALASKNPDSLA